MRRPFRRLRFRREVSADHPSRLAISVRLPAFTAGSASFEPLGWEASAEAVLAGLTTPLEGPGAAPERPIVETLELVADALPIAAE